MKILIVEDHKAMRGMIAEHLVEHGFAVDCATCGEEALAAAAIGTYDAIVLDLGLPDIDGVEVLTEIRRRDYGGPPALLLTARARVEDRILGLNAGADDYLTKPFDLFELEARLRAILRRPGPRRETVYALGALSFNVTSREAFVGELSLDLTRREATLLEEMLRSAGQVVPKDVLEDRIYALEEAGSVNALEAAVSRLRKKLAASKAAVRIETKRGIGYRLAQGREA